MYIYCFILFYIYSFIIVSLFTLETKMEKIQIKQMQWLLAINPFIWLCFFPILQYLKNGKMEKIILMSTYWRYIAILNQLLKHAIGQMLVCGGFFGGVFFKKIKSFSSVVPLWYLFGLPLCLVLVWYWFGLGYVLASNWVALSIFCLYLT